MKVALLSDLHYSKTRNVELPCRAGHYADTLLLRAVHRLNRYLKPDLVILGGDLINDPQGTDAEELLSELGRIIGLLDAPVIAIPGNHDPAPEIFYRHIPRPPEFLDCGGVRFIPFCDAETPGYNAARSAADLERFRHLAAFSGPVVMVQHVPLFRPGAAPSPYHYDNIEEILSSLPQNIRTIAMGGHFHAGYAPAEGGNLISICASALCETPFAFEIINIAPDGQVTRQPHTLKLPEIPGLRDLHVHTRLAYCSENMDVGKTLELARMFGLEEVAFCEHTSHLYWDKELYKQGWYNRDGLTGCTMDRTGEYFALLEPFRDRGGFLTGFELDIDRRGELVVRPEALARAEITLGAVHYMENKVDQTSAKTEFMFKTKALVESGIDILAHPFRAFRRSGLPCPAELFAPVAELLRANGVAAEVNYHTNDPELEFFAQCLEKGVELSFGSDSHNLYEVGEFYPHLEFARRLGIYDRLDEVMYSGPSGE